MLRKDENAAKSIENFDCSVYPGMQKGILENAYKMFKARRSIGLFNLLLFSPEEMKW
ncbi:hypothetical protein [Acetivibrio saccincola]|uniref:hypothetical protein n=1 Tax=Acetivibrio saccincola TaxID=1677857 RepID=UPI0022876625|nr:hypothetical protein [Acetivibrio saccincola]